MVAVVLALSAAPGAAAATRFASPAGSPTSPCSLSTPCSLPTALAGALSGDEVVLAGGNYGPFATELRVDVPIALHGAVGQPRPQISSSAGSGLVLLGGPSTSVQDLEVAHSGINTALHVTGGLVERVVATGSGSNVCAVSRGTILRNSFCRATGAGAALSMAGAGAGPVPRETATVRNVTAVSAGGAGVEVRAGDFAQLDLRASNVIASGGLVDARALVVGTSGTMSAILRFDHSNYDTAEESGGGGVTPPGSPTNQMALPLFRNLAAGDLHQSSRSPTVDAGVPNAANGSTDIDGEARFHGASTDIGADEYLGPETTITAGPSGPTDDTTPSFSFSSSEGGSRFECRVDSAAFAPCSAPHTTTALQLGPHTFEVRAIDAAGNVDPTPAIRTFMVSARDTTPPETVITAGPAGTTTDTTPTFEFVSSEPGSAFECSIDGGPFVPCSSPFTTPPLGVGSHTFEVRAIDPAGNVDPTPAAGINTSAARRAFMVISAALPPPVLGRTFNAEPVGGGRVLVSVPRRTARLSASVPGIKGRTFVPLREPRQLPVGTMFDTRRGTVRLTSARNTRGAVQSGEFVKGVFQVLQSPRPSRKGLTELRLKGASFRSCTRRRQGRRSSGTGEASRTPRTIRRLRGRGRGRFRTRGRYSSATVRGTEWTTADRCDGTLTVVTLGSVGVRDFGRRKTVLVRRGKSYLARADR